MALPEAANPIAKDLFFEKYVARTESAGQNKSPLPRPVQMPCARNSCQYLLWSINHRGKDDIGNSYFVDKEVMKTPKIMKKEPKMMVGLNKP